MTGYPAGATVRGPAVLHAARPSLYGSTSLCGAGAVTVTFDRYDPEQPLACRDCAVLAT